MAAVERDPDLASAGAALTKDLALGEIKWISGKLEQGGPGSAPYDVVLIEGAVRQIPQAILDQMAEGGRLTTIVAGAPGAMGVAQIFVKEGGVTSGRPLFDAGTPLLPGFTPPARFTF